MTEHWQWKGQIVNGDSRRRRAASIDAACLEALEQRRLMTVALDVIDYDVAPVEDVLVYDIALADDGLVAMPLAASPEDGIVYVAQPIDYEAIDLQHGVDGATTLIGSADDASVPVNLGTNTFNLYGHEVSGEGLYVSTNGLITVGDPGGSVFTNADLNGNPAAAAVAPLWDDWRTDLGPLDAVLSRLHDQDSDGQADRLILEWNEVQHYFTSPSTVTFQAILELNTGARPGDVIFNYKDLDTGISDWTNGGSATVGIKDEGTADPRRVVVSLETDRNPLLTSTSAIRLAVVPRADAGRPYSVPEGGAVSLSGAGSTAYNGAPAAYAWDLDGDGLFGETGADAGRGNETGISPTFSAAGLDGPNDTVLVSLRVTDDRGLTSVNEASAAITVTNVAPSVTLSLAAPEAQFARGTAIDLTANFTDPGLLDTHTAVWTLVSNSSGQSVTLTSQGTVAGRTVSTTVNDAANPLAAGVYQLSLTVTDDDGGVGTANTIGLAPATIVVFDATAGFVGGHGWINSPAGALASNRTWTGKAHFAFLSGYRPGSSNPFSVGGFLLKAAGSTFRTTSTDWVVVSGYKAQYKGTATVNGVAGYRFLVTVIDGQKAGGGGVDRIRFKVWNDAGVWYDNQPSAGADDDANPLAALGGGNIVIVS